MNTELRPKKKKRNQSNYKALLLPLAVVLLLLGAVVWNNIVNETRLPHSDWSRSVSTPADSISAEPIALKKDNHYQIYTKQKNGLKVTTLDEKLNLITEKTENLPLDERGNFWTNGQQIAFVSNGELILYEEGKQTVLDKNVELLADSKTRFAYSKGNQVYVYDSESGKSRLIYSAKEKLSELTGHSESNSFIATVGEKVQMEAFYLQEKEGQYKAHSIIQYNKTPTDKIYNFRFAESKDQVHFLYTLYSSKQGTKSFKTYYGAAPSDQLTALSFNTVHFIESDLGYEMENPMYQQLNIENNQPVVLFSAKGPISAKKEAGNIYKATLKNKEWEASRISTTDNFSVYPLYIDEQTIGWLKAESVSDYRVFIASQDSDIKKESQSIGKQDVYNATFDALAASVVSLIAMTSAFIWVVPPVLFLGILYFVRIDVIEQEKPWAKWISIGLFIFTQLYVIQSLFNSTFYSLAPKYLTFSGSSLIVPVIVSAVALYVMQLAKNKDWGLFAQVSYFIGVTVLFELFIVGTYVY
ncbi:hypothetical protein AWM68_11925 [Fictibacillus phosphorivorans]|uniref:Uncharacterized protein n=1 Tax=Fictibacillus phosphorivorans TaxID=1221500 RepID=A0A165MXK3_9BACL|nr:hypothetical protein [Fictibacillus phosphorivorans]KZE63817.1 hypothetical protein AWM68_11925 [Fictibacillus phosphorivorans]